MWNKGTMNARRAYQGQIMNTFQPSHSSVCFQSWMDSGSLTAMTIAPGSSGWSFLWFINTATNCLCHCLSIAMDSRVSGSTSRHEIMSEASSNFSVFVSQIPKVGVGWLDDQACRLLSSCDDRCYSSLQNSLASSHWWQASVIRTKFGVWLTHWMMVDGSYWALRRPFVFGMWGHQSLCWCPQPQLNSIWFGQEIWRWWG